MAIAPRSATKERAYKNHAGHDGLQQLFGVRAGQVDSVGDRPTIELFFLLRGGQVALNSSRLRWQSAEVLDTVLAMLRVAL